MSFQLFIYLTEFSILPPPHEMMKNFKHLNGQK